MTFQRQVEDPSVSGLPAGMSRPMFPNVPSGTGLTWSTTDGVSSPVTGITGPRPPTDPRVDLFKQQAASNAALWDRLRSRTANLPIAQTEAAVTAALRFQGMRQYQRDLEAGLPANEALARSAPMMFAGPKTSTMGQAASFMRATTPTRKYHSAGGVLYQEEPDGTLKPVTGPAPPKYHTAGGVIYREGEGGLKAVTPAPAPKPSAFDTREYGSVLKEIEANNKAISDLSVSDPDMTGPDAKALMGKAALLRHTLEGIRKRSQAAASTAKRVRVRAPSGKTGTLPEDQIEAAKAAGYTILQ